MSDILKKLSIVEPIKAGDNRVICNGEPFKVDFRVIAEDLFQETLAELEQAHEEADKSAEALANEVGKNSHLTQELEATKARVKEINKHLALFKKHYEILQDMAFGQGTEQERMQEIKAYFIKWL